MESIQGEAVVGPVNAELPTNVFYVVVYEDDNAKKAVRRRSFTGYVKFNCEHLIKGVNTHTPCVAGSIPTLFSSKADAQYQCQRAEEYFRLTGSKTVHFSIKPFRIVESDWNPRWYDDDGCAFRDARRMASGVLHYDTVAQQIKKLAGKVLTVVDAAYINEGQNKAVKDLTKNSFRSQLSELWDKSREDPDCESAEGSYQKDILDD